MGTGDLYVLAGSAAVIAFMVGVAALLGFRNRLRIADEADARRSISEADPDVRVADIALSQDGRAGLARLEDGRLAAVRAIGDRVSVRFFTLSAARWCWRGPGLAIGFGDLGYPTLNLKLAERPDWLERCIADAAQNGELRGG